MIFILYIYLHKKRQNASCSFECENRVSTEKRQEMGEGRSESGQWRLLVINVPKRLFVVKRPVQKPVQKGGGSCLYPPSRYIHYTRESRSPSAITSGRSR